MKKLKFERDSETIKVDAILMKSIYRLRKLSEDGGVKVIIEVELDHWSKKVTLRSASDGSRWKDSFTFIGSKPEMVSDIADLMVSAAELAQDKLGKR